MVSAIAENASEVCKEQLITNLGVKATDLEDLDVVPDATLAVNSVSNNALLRPVVFNLGVSGRCLGCRYDRLFYDDEPFDGHDVCAPQRKDFLNLFFEKVELDGNLRNMTKVIDMDYQGESCDASAVQLVNAEVQVSFSTNEPNANLTEDEEVLAGAFGRAYNLANFYSSTIQAFVPDLCDQNYRHTPAGVVTVTSEGQTATFTINDGRCRGCCEANATGSNNLFDVNGDDDDDDDDANEVGNMEVVGNTDPAAERALTAGVGADRTYDCFCAATTEDATRPPTPEEFVQAFNERIGDLVKAGMLTKVTGVTNASVVPGSFSCHNDDSTGMSSS